MSSPVICLVTIHGIGFEQPPLSGVPGYPDTAGYADDLHEHLSEHLDTLLCDDPHRKREKRGQNGPIYVQSVWPPTSYNREAGLSRLGNWDEDHIRTVDGTNAPLSDGTGRIAHIALVYSQAEEQGPQPGATAMASGMATIALGYYAHVTSLVRMLWLDSEPLWQHLLEPKTTQVEPRASLRIRQDPGFTSTKGAPAQQQPPTGFTATLRQLEDDVASYICHNEMRERIRGFVLDALLRLACREDVDGIVINAHSNGTVIAFDVVRELPPFAAKKIAAFVTAGSPLRKYADLFTWGRHMTTFPRIEQWMNFLDPKDPVADRLRPSPEWRVGDPITPEVLTGFYTAVDPNTGDTYQLLIDDQQVNNLVNSSGGGLQAHNYWDNDPDFVKPLAGILQKLATQE